MMLRFYIYLNCDFSFFFNTLASKRINEPLDRMRSSLLMDISITNCQYIAILKSIDLKSQVFVIALALPAPSRRYTAALRNVLRNRRGSATFPDGPCSDRNPKSKTKLIEL